MTSCLSHLFHSLFYRKTEAVLHPRMMIMIPMPRNAGFDTLDPVADPARNPDLEVDLPLELVQNRQNSRSQCLRRNCQNRKMFEIFKTYGNCDTLPPWEFFLYFSHCTISYFFKRSMLRVARLTNRMAYRQGYYKKIQSCFLQNKKSEITPPVRTAFVKMNISEK